MGGSDEVGLRFKGFKYLGCAIGNIFLKFVVYKLFINILNYLFTVYV